MPADNLHLKLVKGRWLYVRRVPEVARGIDPRFPAISFALGTTDQREARYLRDQHDKRNDAIWKSIRRRLDAGDRMQAFNSQTDLEHALGLPPAGGTDLAEEENRQALIDRVLAASAAMGGQRARPVKPAGVVAEAVLQRIERPNLRVSEMATFYCETIRADERRRKSPGQIKQWEKWPRLAAETFLDVVGDREVLAITRDEANRFRRHWSEKLQQVNPKTGRLYTGDAANRCCGTMRRMIAEIAEYQGIDQFKNPFADIVFDQEERRRVSADADFVRDKLLHGPGLAGLNAEARAVMLLTIETGVRLSEAANLRAEHIRLDDPVPHIRIEPVREGEGRREIKTRSSVREIPLVGVSLAAAQKYPNGFPQYRDRGAQLSALLGKYTRDHGLRAAEGATAAHSIRHGFKDRLRDAEVNEALIDFLVGHRRPGIEYGRGYTLKAKQAALLKIALPFDSAVLG